MTLWWIGNILLLLVVAPVVVVLLGRLLMPAIEIRKYADDIEKHGKMFDGHLATTEELNTTRERVREVRAGIERYTAALDDIL